jgi:hypothetical protein
MPIKDIVNVSIDLQTTGVTRAGFGTPLFIGANRWILSRTSTYSSLEDASSDIPAGTPEYAALQAFFAQTPSPQFVKIGRRESDVLLDPATPAEGDVYSVTVSDALGNSVVASHTVGAAEDEEDIVDGIKSAIDGDVDIAAVVSTTKNGTGAATTLSLSPDSSGDLFTVSAITANITTTFPTTETAAQCMSAITDEDDDFYFVTAHDHTETFVLGMAADVEARSKLYFVSLQEQGALASLADPATDIFGKLFELNYFRTIGLFHHTADTTFPECAFAGKGAPFDPGTITWSHKQLAGVSDSADPSTSKKLTTTQINYLFDRNVNFVYSVGGVSIVRTGKVMVGEWIDVVRSRDFLESRIKEAFQNKLINTGKVPYTDTGINSMRGVLESTLSRYVSSEGSPNILQEVNPFTTTFPRAADVSFADKSARELNASFTAFLAGAIHIISITGTLTLEAA